MNVRNATVWAIVFLSLTAVSALAQVEFPDTRAGTIAKAYFAAFNSVDAGRGLKFATTYRSESALARRPAEEQAQRQIEISIAEQFHHQGSVPVTTGCPCSVHSSQPPLYTLTLP